MNIHTFLENHKPLLTKPEYGNEPPREEFLSMFYGQMADRVKARESAKKYADALKRAIVEFAVSELKNELDGNFSTLPEIVRDAILVHYKERIK